MNKKNNILSQCTSTSSNNFSMYKYKYVHAFNPGPGKWDIFSTRKTTISDVGGSSSCVSSKTSTWLALAQFSQPSKSYLKNHNANAYRWYRSYCSDTSCSSSTSQKTHLPFSSLFYAKYKIAHKYKLEINGNGTSSTRRPIMFLENDPLLDMRWVEHFSDDYSLQDQQKMQINLFFLKFFQQMMKADEWGNYLPEKEKDAQEIMVRVIKLIKRKKKKLLKLVPPTPLRALTSFSKSFTK